MRKISKVVAAVAAVIIVTMLVLFLSLPWLVSRFGATYLEQHGFNKAEVEIGYPDWQGVSIEHTLLISDAFELRTRDVSIEYLWSDLFSGQIQSIQLAQVDLIVLPTDTPTTESNDISIEALFAAVPFEEVHVDRLHLQVPELEFAGQGSVDLADSVLVFGLQGLEPEIADQFRVDGQVSKDGQLDLRFADQAADSSDHLELTGQIAEDLLEVKGDVYISGYAFNLACALAGLPSGTGKLEGKIGAQIPWPVSSEVPLEKIVAQATHVNAMWSAIDEVTKFDVTLNSASLEDGEAAATLTGNLNTQVDDYSVTVQFSEDFMIHYDAKKLTGSAGLQLTANGEDQSLSALVDKFVVQTQPVTQLEFEAHVTAQAAGGQLIGSLAAGGTFRDAKTPMDNASGHIFFDGEVGLDNVRHPAKIEANYEVSSSKLKANGQTTVRMLDNVDFALAYDIETGAGGLEVNDGLEITQPLVATFLPKYDAAYDLDRGSIDSSLKLNWQNADKIRAEVTLSLQSVGAHYDEYTIHGISGQARLSTPDLTDLSAWTLVPTKLQASGIDIGFPLNQVEVALSYTQGRANVSQVGAVLLGGRMNITPFEYDPTTGNAELVLHLVDVDLAQVLALEGEDVSGTGKLSGTLPISMTDNEPTVRNGIVRAEPPGGTIQLSPALARPTGQPGLDFALSALQNFGYSDLDANINYAKNGDLKLGVSLLGTNPDVEKGRAIEYNLNISENLPVLLESLRLQDKVTERIEKQVNK